MLNYVDIIKNKSKLSKTKQGYQYSKETVYEDVKNWFLKVCFTYSNTKKVNSTNLLRILAMNNITCIRGIALLREGDYVK